ncbi:hypothetical protein [Natrialba aegyptia]|uniref:Uncharacterized protein n=1 Tax=Natrialba aegyptia DSM 13077 TaxID=1227491 RepID=M0B0W6_9EURY|nr:hypothetical protein [Natrialba aegyptia]ELZ03344.1 hypothetical protein C480_16465 [Natrialba aegyptia DSM 13077]
MTDTLRERVETLEAELRRKDDRIATLEARLETAIDRLDTLEPRLANHDDRLETHENACHDHATRLDAHDDRLQQIDALADATRNRTGANKARIEELQARELEKGAHLETATVDEHELEVQGDRLERITKDDGRSYFRVPDSADPLDSGHVSLAYGDLLPIQQLARMDTDRRRAAANTVPTRLAAALWQARTDPSIGDDPWEPGCKNVRAFVTASDLKHWIRRQEPGTSETYAKKLVSRTIDALLDLSKHRLAVRRTTQRKNGLEYTERRLILPADAAIPGETGRTRSNPNRDRQSNGTDEDASPESSPPTTDVHG